MTRSIPRHDRWVETAGSSFLLLLVLTLLSAHPGAATVAAWTVSPGPARADRQGDRLVLVNRALEASWTVKDGHLRASGIRNRLAEADLPRTREVFVLLFRGGRTVAASSLSIVAGPE